MKKILSFILALSVSLGISACLNAVQNPDNSNQSVAEQQPVSGLYDSNISKCPVKKNNPYSDKDSVSLYIHYFKKLPPNYITKKEAQKLGGDNTKGNLHEVAPGKSIGGDRFGNYEDLLPKEKKRQYYECDIDYKKGKRNAKRIVFSNDGLIYYTQDHYKTFEKIY